MKTFFSTVILCAVFFLCGCGVFFADSGYVPRLPELPPAWENLLGSPRWQVDWLNSEGQKETVTIQDGHSMEIFLPQTWATPISAAPFWPEKGIGPGIFKPAGAIFPFDVSGKNLVLSWQGGVDAVFFRELAEAAGFAANLAAGRAVSRVPMNFNWPRFRQLFDDPSLNAQIRDDPWLADWRGIAEKTIQSGFDRRRLVPEPRNKLEVPVGPGPWAGVSPFAAPLIFETIPVFSVRPAADTWVSAEGLLRCSTETWLLMEW